MHIIFGKDRELEAKYTLLELDTFRFESLDQTKTAYCVLENIPITDLPKLQSMKNLHANLIDNYKKRDWNYCLQAIEHLMGFWGNELDSFYSNLHQRITKYQDNDPGSDWTPILSK